MIISTLMDMPKERVIDAFLKIENPLFIDAKGAKWDELNTEYGETTREIVRRADNGNYDGVIFEDIADSWIDDEDGGTFTVYYPFKNDQIKYADTVTYNDNGNIIPLSERFNSENADIRYSIDEEFEADIDQWEEDGRPEGESFILGSTGDVLQGLAAIESDIYMQGDKIKTILREHPEMRLDEIKKILQVLDDPVLILKSRNVGRDNAQNTRLVIFGAVRAQNGKPVLSVLDLRPSEGRLIIDDMQKVNSAYVKDTGPVRFVRKSEVLYADKKRTSQLLRWVGFQMPTELLRHGSMGTITDEGDDVNISGEKFSEIVRERTEEARYSIEEDVAELDEAYRQMMDCEQPHRTAGDLKWEIRDTIERGSRQEQATEPTATVTRTVPAGEFYPEGPTVTHTYERGKPV